MPHLPHEAVVEGFQEIISKYDLQPVSASDEEVVLCGASYAIGVFLDFDGLHYTYYDRRGARLTGYSLAKFLYEKRRDRLNFDHRDLFSLPLREYLKFGMETFSNQLLAGGGDILDGDKRWMKKYPWKPVAAPKDVVLALQRIG